MFRSKIAPTIDQYLARPSHPLRLQGGKRVRGIDNPKGDLAHPLVSIVTVVKNAGRTIERTIQSVLYQTYPSIEYIIVDGSSTDRTLEIIRSYVDGITYWMSEPDVGIYDAFNKGLAASTGDYIGFLNADDWMSPNQIERAVEAIRNSHADFVMGDIWMHGWQGKDSYIAGDPYYQSVIRRKMPSLFQTTALCSRAMFQSIGLFHTNYRIVSDYDWFLRADLAGFRGFYDRRIVGHMQYGGASTANQRFAIFEGFIVCLRNGGSIFRSLAIWGLWFLFPNGKPTLKNILASLPFSKTADQAQNQGETLPRRPMLDVFLDSRDTALGFPDDSIEWLYLFGRKTHHVLLSDRSPRGEEIGRILLAAGSWVEYVNSSVARPQGYQETLVIEKMPSPTRFVRMLDDYKKTKGTIIISSMTEIKDHAIPVPSPSKRFGEIGVYQYDATI